MEQKFYKTYKITSKKFWLNFWEYYKIHLFAVILILAMAVIGIRSCVMRVDYDVTVYYYGENPMYSPAVLQKFIEERAKDLDGDGKVTAHISNNPLGKADTNEAAATIYNQIDANFMAGDPFIFMTDEEFIGRYLNMSKNMSALQPLDEIIQGIDIPEQYLIRNDNTNEVVAIDVTNMPIAELSGNSPTAKMYVGMKILPTSEKDNKEYLLLHDQAEDIIRQMLEYKK